MPKHGTGWFSSRVFVALLLAAGTAVQAFAADASIDVVFEDGGTPREQIIHVEADLGAAGPDACQVLCGLTNYVELHPWIAESELEWTFPDGTRVVRFVLDLPWPLGRQWSRLEVEQFGDRTLAWQQVEGSFRSNHGTLVLRPQDGGVHLSYWAVIDLGLPNVVTRPFQEQFIREFLGAVRTAASRSGSY
jgi:hypothetical protein